MRIQKVVLFFALMLLAAPANAQKRILEEGDKHFTNMAYNKALDFYKSGLNKRKGKKNPVLYQKLANTYRILRDFGKAEFYYEKALQYDRTPDAELVFNYAQALMNNQKHSFAMPWLEKYASMRPRDTRTARMIEWCMDYDELRNSEAEYEIYPVPFNSIASDFSPVYHNDEIVFSSSRNDPFAGKDQRTGESFLQLYTIEETNGVWSKVGKLPGRTRTKFHEGTAAFSPNGREMFYTRNEIARDYGKGKVSILKLYRAVMDNSSWEEIEALPFNATEQALYSVGQPALSPNGKFLYFTSDMPGGYGGKDLYVVERYGLTRWSKPVNLGPTINTEGDEMFPFMHDDGSLYFATDGHGGYGGLDIYNTVKLDNIWGVPKNMGQPINSEKDDFSIVYDEKKEYGFFASSRFGGMGGDDIYQFKNLNPNRQLMVSKQLVSKGNKEAHYTSAADLEYNAPDYDFDDESGMTSNDNDPEALTAVLIGRVLDERGVNPVANAEVEMEELLTGVKEVYFTEIDGHFYFQLQMGTEYRLRYKENRMVFDEQIVNAEGVDNKIVNVELRHNRNAFEIEDEEPALAMEEFLQPQVTVDTFSYSKGDVIMDTFRTEQKSYARTYLNDMAENDSVKTEDIIYQVLTFKVQIGAFRAASPPSDNYLRKAKELVEQEFTNTGYIRYVTQTAFSSLNEAENYMEYIMSLGYGDSYLVPYLNGSRLDMSPEEAIEYVN